MQISRKITKSLYGFLMLGLLLFLPVSCATEPDTDIPGEAPAVVEAEDDRYDDDGDLFLWTIEHNDVQMHILGSIHLASEEIYPLPDEIYRLFESSDRLILEIDLNSVSADAFFGVQSLMEYPEGQNLEDDLNSDEIKLLTGVLAEFGIPFHAVKHLKPWVIEATIVTQLAAAHGINPDYGIDMHFAQLAAELEMPVHGLETVEMQLSMFGELPTRTQAAEMMRSIENYKELGDYVAHLLQIWHSGDLEAMTEVIVEALLSTDELEVFYELMFAARNRKWHTELLEYLENGGNSFVVVGAGHLVGPDNLIELMRSSGYRAIRM
ncbi:TraB/GumN family protein [Spirochaeta dissipatitropha]